MADLLLQLGFSQSDLIKLAQWEMPFGKYKNTRLIDLPEEYLFWFHRRSFPDGELGRLMALCLELKIEGLDALIKPLKNSSDDEGDEPHIQSSDIVIRELRSKEVDLYSQLVLNAYSKLDGFPNQQQQPQYYKLLANLDFFSKFESSQFLGAFTQNNQLIGGVIYFGDMKDYGSGGLAPEVKNASGLRFLAIDSDSQGQGVGKLLTLHCIKLARENDRQEIILHTIEIMKAAWRLYQGLGFKRSVDLDFFENSLQIYGFRLII